TCAPQPCSGTPQAAYGCSFYGHCRYQCCPGGDRGTRRLRLGVQRPPDSVRARLSGPHDHTVVEDHSGTSPTTSTT
ncbi:hypothetical protein FOZ63_023299, partial [Perkinsus olseni]